jgi:hypothetical protein
MTMPSNVQELLMTIGQVAAELPNTIDGYRDFVTVYRFETSKVLGFEGQYPYLVGNSAAYRLLKFRVDESLIEEDVNVCNEDLIGLQCIVVATEAEAATVLDMWSVDPSILRMPKETEVPV